MAPSLHTFTHLRNDPFHNIVWHSINEISSLDESSRAVSKNTTELITHGVILHSEIIDISFTSILSMSPLVTALTRQFLSIWCGFKQTYISWRETFPVQEAVSRTKNLRTFEPRELVKRWRLSHLKDLHYLSLFWKAFFIVWTFWRDLTADSTNHGQKEIKEEARCR